MKILKIIGIAFCGLMTLGGVAAFFSGTSSEPDVAVLIITLIFLVFTVLLIRSIKKGNTAPNLSPKNSLKSKDSSVSPYLPEVPAEILRDMKKHYTSMQIQNDVRILQESFKLVQETTDFDTFFMRLELSQQKALTLLQAVQAGCKGIQNKQQTVRGCEAVLSSVQNVKTVFLDNNYKKETNSALQLKTKAGQYKRLCSYLERLKSHEEQFSDVEGVFGDTITRLETLIAEIQPERSKPHAFNP